MYLAHVLAFLVGDSRVKTSDPAHIKILKSVTHYEAVELSSFFLFFGFHEWNRTKRLGIKD